MRSRIALAACTAALALAGSVFAASPASAACTAPCADTTVTFTVTSGGLAIAAPSSLALTGAGAALSLTAGTVSGTASAVTVTDQRGGLGVAGWTVSGSVTDFTTTDNGGGTIAKSNAVGYSGAGTIVSGVPVLVPTLVAAPVNLGTGGTLISATSATGSNSASYTPTVTVTVPTTAVPGAYSGTLTQTVA